MTGVPLEPPPILIAVLHLRPSAFLNTHMYFVFIMTWYNIRPTVRSFLLWRSTPVYLFNYPVSTKQAFIYWHILSLYYRVTSSKIVCIYEYIVLCSYAMNSKDICLFLGYLTALFQLNKLSYIDTFCLYITVLHPQRLCVFISI